MVFTSSVASKWYPKIIKLNNTHEIVNIVVKISIPLTLYGIVPHIKNNSNKSPYQPKLLLLYYSSFFSPTMLSCTLL